MLAGRALDERDRTNTAFVAVVNETLAKRLFPNLEPAAVVGQPVRLFGTTGATNEIVGVAANVRSRRPDAVPDPEIYVSFHQIPSPGTELRGPRAGRSGGAHRPDSQRAGADDAARRGRHRAHV